MSIDLDIGVLSETVKACYRTADSFKVQSEAASVAALTLGLGWEGKGYSSFYSTVQDSSVPGALVAAGACQTLGLALDDARKQAALLRSRAEGFQSILVGETTSMYSDTAEFGRLYSDDATFDPIDADLAAADEVISTAQRALWAVEDILWGMKTRSARVDGAGFSAALTGISSRLSDFRVSFSTYRSDMAEMEASSLRLFSSVTEPFAVRPVSSVYENGKVKDTAALAWWLSRPYASLTSEERAFVDGLRAQGLSMPKLNKEGLSKEGLASVGYEPNDEGDMIETLFSGAGYAVGMHKASLSLGEELVKKFGDAQGFELVNGIKKTLDKVSWVLSFTSASFASTRYYENHPELPEDRRASNQAAEWDLQFAKSVISVIPPFEDAANFILYDEEVELGMTRADQFYEWRYNTLGKHGW